MSHQNDKEKQPNHKKNAETDRGAHLRLSSGRHVYRRVHCGLSGSGRFRAAFRRVPGRHHRRADSALAVFVVPGADEKITV